MFSHFLPFSVTTSMKNLLLWYLTLCYFGFCNNLLILFSKENALFRDLKQQYTFTLYFAIWCTSLSHWLEFLQHKSNFLQHYHFLKTFQKWDLMMTMFRKSSFFFSEYSSESLQASYASRLQNWQLGIS